MKFQMAPNSLFAILLRSRWWISFVVGAVIVLLTVSLLPQDLKLVGALGSVPFFAIGFVALVRQLQAPSPAQTQALLNQAASQNWPQFAQLLEAAWRAEGYNVERLPQGEADFVLTRQGKTALVYAKRWKAATHGIEPLKQLQAATAQRQLQDAVYIALNPLHDNARNYARDHNMVVLQGQELATLLAKGQPGK